MLQTEQQGRKASWLNTQPPWHKTFFSVVFSTQRVVGVLGEAAQHCCLFSYQDS